MGTNLLQRIGLAASQGLAGASGDEATANRAQQGIQDLNARRQQNLQFQLAPLSQSLAADRERLKAFTDPNTGEPVEEHQADYDKIHNRMVDTIGQMRELLGQHPPGETPFATRLLDKFHVANDLSNHFQQKRSDQVNQYYAQNRAMADAAANSSFEPNPYTTQARQLGQAGFTPEEAHRAVGYKAGVVPKLQPDGQPYQGTDGKWYQNYKDPYGNLTQREMPANYAGKDMVDTRKRKDYENYKAANPEYKGSFEQWVAQEGAAGRNAVPRNNRDDKYIAIEQKRLQGQPLSPDERAYAGAYDLYVKKTKVDPGIARAVAYGQNRPVMVIDPADPTGQNVVFVPSGVAEKAHLGTTQSIGFQTDKAVTRYMTAGKGGENINYFNTAVDHLKLLQQASDALNNGDYPLANRLANSYAQQTGSPAPTNFDAVKAAVSGEISKTFKGTGATDEEIKLINQTIDRAASPQAITGAIGYYTDLMNGKLNALQGQYEAGRQGKPNFVGPKTKSLKDQTKKTADPLGVL